MSITRKEAIDWSRSCIESIPMEFCWIGDTYVHFSVPVSGEKVTLYGYGIIDDIVWEKESGADQYILISNTSLSVFPPVVLPPLRCFVYHLVRGFYTVKYTDIHYILPINIERINSVLKTYIGDSVKQDVADNTKILCDKMSPEEAVLPDNIYEFRPKSK